MFHGINWGDAGAWAGAFLSLGSAIGYAAAHDWRRALYFFFACAITVTIAWPAR
jgi:hypothetical protein